MLKLLNNEGEFINAEAGEKVLEIAEKEEFNFVPVDKLGTYTKDDSYLQKHIDAVIKLSIWLMQMPLKKQNLKLW